MRRQVDQATIISEVFRIRAELPRTGGRKLLAEMRPIRGAKGILKQEFYLDQVFANKVIALKAVREAVRLYNTRRLHEALGYVTPHEFRLRNAA